MKLYCLSGLGVDHRAFLKFHPAGIELVHIPWIPPQRNESVKSYAKRLFEKTELPDDYALLGVSFGGMVAAEFAHLKKPKHLFLVSTNKGYKDLPFEFKMGRYIPLQRIAPTSFLTSGNRFMQRRFGVVKNEDKELLKEILKDTDPFFLRWAMNALLFWESPKIDSEIRIHGTNDKMLPPTKNINHWIQGAGHFMIVDRADEIAEIVANEMKN